MAKGMFIGNSHANGGIPSEIAETGTKIEIEGNEYYICNEAYNSPNHFDFKKKTNKEILDFIYTEFACKLNQDIMHSGDFIVCKVVVADNRKKDRKGTIKQILNEMQGEKNCKVESSSNYLKKGGELIKRADGSYSKRGLWDNIRANIGSGRKPTKEMLKQEAIIREKYHLGGDMSKHLAPNGKPSNLTHEQWHLVRTDAFKKWFGDWENDPANASKVVDENGEPLVVYHGTDANFYEFKKQQGGWETFWFSPNRATAKIYAQQNNKVGKVFQCFLNVRNTSKKYPFNLNDYDGFIDYKIEMDYFTFKQIKTIQVIQVVNSNQIKLADGTNTTFDSNNNDIRFDEGGNIKTQKNDMEKPILDFMKSSPMQQARAITALEKRIRSNDKVMPIYEWIEGFEKGLETGTTKIYSSKSEKGYTEKLVIGNHLVDYKAEQDYYKYLQAGGESYSIYLERKKKYDDIIKAEQDAKRKEADKIRDEENKIREERVKKAKDEQIKTYIEQGKESILEYLTSKFKNNIKNLKNKPKTEANEKEIAYNERMIEQATTQNDKAYKTATELYKISDGEVVNKYDWKVGDKVLYDGRIETEIINVDKWTENDIENVTYKVEKMEGIYNQYIGYDGLFPIEADNDMEKHTYALTLRPFDIGTYPKENFVRFVEEEADNYKFGLLEYSKELPIETIKHFSLAPVSDLIKYDGKEFYYYEDLKGKAEILKNESNIPYVKATTFDEDNELNEEVTLSGQNFIENIKNGRYRIIDHSEAKELEKGIAVEQEHLKTFEKVAAGDITPEQAAESPEYYKELDKMEEKLKNKKDIDYSELPPLKREDLELVEAFKSADKNTKKIKFIWNGDFYEWEYSSTGSGGGIHIRKYDSLRKLQNPLSTTGTHETIYNTWNSYQTTPEGRYIEYSISKMNKDDIFGYDNNNLTDSKISLKVEDYKNPYQINKAIEKLIDQKGDSKDYSSKELEFISYYSGYGGLEKFGEIGKERLKGLMYEFYTPDAVVKKMWALAYKYGYGTIADNSVFEPSVGIGAFLKYAPSNVRIVANEINEYSAKICEILYPQAKVELKYFEQNFIKNNLSIKSKIYDLDKYSLVIGNPPYGVLNSKYIGMGEDKFTTASNYTEYFITRGLDLLVQDGLLIYIVGAEQYNGGSLFLDSGLSKVKEMMFDKADLVDAYRLPVNIFERTGVSSEIVVFKKR